MGLVYEIYKSLGLETVIKINDRALFEDIEPRFLTTIDKLGKIGRDGVLKELESRGLTEDAARRLLERIEKLQPTDNLQQIIKLYGEMGYPRESLHFDPALVRGLDYYTGMICEATLESQPSSPSLGGGGRYDRLIGKFTGMDLPAVGFAVGLDRTIEAMEEQGLLQTALSGTVALVTVFSPGLTGKSLAVVSKLRSAGIPTELWLDPDAKLERQLKYANQKHIPYAVIIGPEEAKKEELVLKNLSDGNQQRLMLDELTAKLGQ